MKNHEIGIIAELLNKAEMHRELRNSPTTRNVSSAYHKGREMGALEAVEKIRDVLAVCSLVPDSRLLDLTEGLLEHPDDWDYPCYCDECKEYGA